MAGYFEVRATRIVNTHVLSTRGATRRPSEIKHRPVSLHRLRPSEIVVTSASSDVLDRRATVDFFTVNPGRALCTNLLAEIFPVGDFVVMEKV